MDLRRVFSFTILANATRNQMVAHFQPANIRSDLAAGKTAYDV
jgi:hypothetical protein